MISLVLVSHSRILAQALVGLVRQMAAEQVRIAIAAGAGDDHADFGTDAVEIAEAIQSVDSPDGILVLMDLGSAILSAEMALELLPDDLRARVHFCPAPLVEGAIAAGVQAGLGSSLEACCAEAQQALHHKRVQLGYDSTEPTAAEPAQAETANATGAPAVRAEMVLKLKNLHGLHARPAARFVQTAASFDADILVADLTNSKGPVSARSLNALTTLGAVQHHEIRLSASGPQAAQALQALSRLVEDGFGETETEPVKTSLSAAPISPAETEGNALAVIPIAEGVALGPLMHYTLPPPPVSTQPSAGLEEEWNALQAACGRVRAEIGERRRQTKLSLGEEQAAIFDAHLLILDDPDLNAHARRLIESEHKNAAAAWQAAVQAAAAQYTALPDAYLQQRAGDVLDVGNQVLYVLAGQSAGLKLEFPHPVILVAEELTPTQTAQLDLKSVLGLVSLVGGPTSHSAILARSLGIPAVTGVPPSVARLPANTTLALDGARGLLWIEPDLPTERRLLTARQTWLAQRESLLRQSQDPAITQDGRRVEVAANAGSLSDAQTARANGAEGIGLLRTEFLFLTREDPPGEDEQYEAIRRIGEALAPNPVIVRTLDIGGDKAVPYIDLPAEANPFLGVRAIRLSFQRPDLFRTQLRAILRAAAHARLRIMFPMIANLDEIRRARAALEAARLELLAENIPHGWPLETGIMVEIPSAAVLAPLLAPEVDFFSIGTNDLTQYTLAAERGNPHLAEFADALHPAVLRLIEQVAAAAHAHGKWTGVCGELAGDPLGAAVLVGLGVDELSLNPGGIPRVKAIVRALSTADAQALARQVLQSEGPAEARRIAKAFAAQLNLPII